MPTKNRNKKPTKQELKRVESLTLTLQDRFYIEGHGDLSIEQIARDIGKPADIVEEYAKSCIDKEKRSRGKKAFQSNPKKGYVSMTEAASSVVDEANKKYVSLEAINRAITEGNHELAKELKQRFDEQKRADRNKILKKYSDRIHFIQPIDNDADNGDIF